MPWRQALNLMIVDGFPGGRGAEAPWPVEGKFVHPWALLQSPTEWSNFSTCKTQHQNAVINGYGKNQDASYGSTTNQKLLVCKTKNQKMLSEFDDTAFTSDLGFSKLAFFRWKMRNLLFVINRNNFHVFLKLFLHKQVDLP